MGQIRLPFLSVVNSSTLFTGETYLRTSWLSLHIRQQSKLPKWAGGAHGAGAELPMEREGNMVATATSRRTDQMSNQTEVNGRQGSPV